MLSLAGNSRGRHVSAAMVGQSVLEVDQRDELRQYTMAIADRLRIAFLLIAAILWGLRYVWVITDPHPKEICLRGACQC